MSDLRNSKLVQPVRAPSIKHGRIVVMVPTLWAEYGKACGQTVGKLVCFAKQKEQFINGFVHQFFHTPRKSRPQPDMPSCATCFRKYEWPIITLA